jgi:hypothetical protein
MTLERKGRNDESSKNAADELAKLTGKQREDFAADDYEIPDFENQELMIKEKSED